jgi:phage shock protein PspC (stress-responsive transcriptional regulator)
MERDMTAMARDDTLLGACYAVGRDFGFNPLYLRILFAFGVLSSPALALTAYAALTAILVLARWMVPDPLGPAGEETRTSLEEAPGFYEELRLAA